jgi:hypothetical protein
MVVQENIAHLLEIAICVFVIITNSHDIVLLCVICGYLNLIK